jgi:hypothetical protein
MAPEYVPGGAVVSVKQLAAGEDIYNVLHFVNSGGVPWNSGDLVTLATQVMAAWQDNLQVLMGTAWAIVSVTATDISGPGGAQGIANPVGPGAGGSASPLLPLQVALVATLRTGRVGRAYRGRTYLGGWTESESDGPVVDPSIFPTVQGAIASWSGQLLAIRVGIWGVMSTQLGGVPRPVNVITPIVAVDVRDARWDTQRRRQPRS